MLYDKDPTVFKKEAIEAAKLKEKEKAKDKGKKGGDEAEAEEEKKEEEEEDKPPQYKTFDNSSTTLYDIFGEYGVEMKKELEEDTEEA